MGDLLWQQITQFVDFMSNAHAELKSPEKLVYVIGIINQLKVKFPVWKSPQLPPLMIPKKLSTN